MYKDREKQLEYQRNWWKEHRQEMREKRNKTNRRCLKQQEKEKNLSFLREFLLKKRQAKQNV